MSNFSRYREDEIKNSGTFKVRMSPGMVGLVLEAIIARFLQQADISACLFRVTCNKVSQVY